MSDTDSGRDRRRIRAVVVDDEPVARRRLRRLLGEHPDVEVVAEAASGDEAEPVILEQRPDVVFLDVRMPGKDGLQALRDLHRRLPEGVRPRVVFTTAYEEHAVEAFELEGTDYLVKPVESAGLDRALRRVRRKTWRADRGEGGAETDGEGEPAGETAGGEPGRPRSREVGHLAAHRAGKIVRLALDRIAAVTVEDTITWVHAPDGRYRLKSTLKEVESRLPTPPFVRVSRSAIVNLEWIDHLAPMFSGTYVARLREPVEMEVDVSRRRARDLRDLLGW